MGCHVLNERFSAGDDRQEGPFQNRYFFFLFLFLTLSTFFPPLKYGITRKLEDCLGRLTLGGGPSLVLRSVSMVLCRESRTRHRTSAERALEPPFFSASG